MSKHIVKILCLCLLTAVPNMAQAATTIEDTVAAVLAFSPSLKSIQENRIRMLHEVRRAEGAWYPSVNLQGSTSYAKRSGQNKRGQSTNEYKMGADLSLTLSQTLWDGMATTNRVKAAEWRVESLDHRVFDNASALGLEGIIAHVEVLTRTEMLKLAEEYVATHESILSKQGALTEMGISTTADVSKAQGYLANAKATYTSSLSALEQAQTEYTRVTGKPVPTDLVPGTMPTTVLESLEVVTDRSLSANPKILAYQTDIRAAQSDRDITKSAFQPNFALRAGPTYSVPGSTNKRDYDGSMSVGVNMNWNLYNGGSDVAAENSANASVRQTRQDFYTMVDSVVAEVRNSWTAYETSMRLEDAYSTALEYNRQTRASYLEQFSIGLRSLLDVLDAENEVYTTTTNLIAAQSNKLINAYKLLALDGRFLQEFNLDSANFTVSPDTSERIAGAFTLSR